MRTRIRAITCVLAIKRLYLIGRRGVGRGTGFRPTVQGLNALRAREWERAFKFSGFLCGFALRWRRETEFSERFGR